ncbi:hypothetical protein [Romboutsia sp.]|uniref:hypothetical protein n=1 Tax=Romboutsia sp. TaxID=1965302 RepID=UPI002BCF4B65|nr:hypothetical protein [Romboutsia sp.]HSQ88642.1 hypothetical protein [Romboutsia sp.]
MLKKLRNNKGSAMLLAIFAMILITMVILLFTTQIGNQIKSTIRNSNKMANKYKVEAKIETYLAKVIESIDVEAIENKSTSDKWVLDHYEIQYYDTITKKNKTISVNKNEKTEFNLIINESIEGYVIEAEFLIKISNITKKSQISPVSFTEQRYNTDYNVNYDVIKWNKK